MTIKKIKKGFEKLEEVISVWHKNGTFSEKDKEYLLILVAIAEELNLIRNELHFIGYNIEAK